MSAELQWLLTKNSNVFVLNRRNTGTKKLSLEQNNVAGVHCYRFSGLVHKRAVGINEAADRKGAVLSVRKGRKTVRVTLKKHARAGVRAVRAHTNKTRPDLTKVALQKWTSLARAQRRAAPKKAVTKA